jgi:enoyl-CoA hydratase
MTELPHFSTLLLERRGRLLTLTLNRPDSRNAFDLAMHDELPDALAFARDDAGSDLIVLTGAGRAFSAGGDLDHIARNAAEPERFDHEIAQARRIVLTLLDIAKPVVCRLNGHAVGLGATLALFCDIVIAADSAKIGDPHVGIGLVAGDGGAIIWPQLIGLVTGELLTATRAAEIGLINHAVPAEALDATVDACCQKLLGGAQLAIRRTKALLQIELRRITTALLDQGLAWEGETVRTADHREAIAALREKRPPRLGAEPERAG